VLEQEERRNYNVFHVEEALGSPYIPAQKEFVVPYGIRSIVGFGGVVRNDLFAVILFSRVKIARASAERFRSVALELRRGLFDIEPGNIWGRARDSTPVSTRAQRITPN
jgi:hypothetical protein